MASNRHSDLTNLEGFITRSDNEITMILQSLQWNREILVSNTALDSCTYDNAHKISTKKLKEHEEQCWLRIHGYTKEEKLLPEPLNTNAHAIVKLSSKDINLIIANASTADPDFKKGNVWNGPAPLTLERLQATYTVDERRAIYDAVVASDPTSHDISDLALNNVNDVKTDKKGKSRLEILSELRDMRRRRTKYRVAAKTKKYSDVLRDVIRTQMEMYTGIPSEQEDTIEKIAHSHKKLDNETKRERSLSLERVNRNKMFYHENKPSTSRTSINSRDEINKNKYTLKTKSDIHIDKTKRKDKYNESHHSRSNVKGRSHENLDNRRNYYRDRERSRPQDKSYDRNKHDDYKRGNRPNRGERCSDESKTHDSNRSFNNNWQGYTDDHKATGFDRIKIKEEYKSKNESIGYNRNLQNNTNKVKVKKETTI